MSDKLKINKENFKIKKTNSNKNETQIKVAEDLNKLFNFLYRMQQGINLDYRDLIVNKASEIVAGDKTFYDNKDKKIARIRQEEKRKLADQLNTDDEDVFALLDLEFGSPYSVFYVLLSHDIPDLMISKSMIKIQYSYSEYYDIKVPYQVRDSFSYFLDHFIELQKYINEIKLNNKDAIIDSDFENYRFNIVHKSLNSDNSHVLTIRKHTQNIVNSPESLKNYENSLGITKEQLDDIKNRSNNSIVVFGLPGSGKTTLLRHLINHEFKLKRNVCVIEDSKELHLDTPLSFITNTHYNIKDLFKSSLRQNPSHLVIGETRTDEIVDIMEAGLTSEVYTTIHATKSLQRAIERIFLMSRPRGIKKEDIMSLISSSVSMFIYMDKREIKGAWVRNEEISENIFDLYEQII